MTTPALMPDAIDTPGGASRRLRVYLCRGDDSAWAIDEDRRLTALSLEGLVEFVDDPARADVVHACWWEPLLKVPPEACRGKPVVCHLEEEVGLRLSSPDFRRALARVTHWIAISRSAERDLRLVARDVTYIPYSVDVGCFERPPEPMWEPVARAAAAIPEGSYPVVCTHRDTLGECFAPGARLGDYRPKQKKGPDALVEILAELRGRGAPVVAVLAGPRRHWIREELSRRSVPWVFAGELSDDDDYPGNILPLHQVAHLLKISRVQVSASRHEGGPRCVLEAAAAGVAQLSTPVGLAPDVLPPDCLFTDPVRAVELIQADLEHQWLSRWTPMARAAVLANHTPEANRGRWARFYARVSAQLGAPHRAGAPKPYKGATDRPVPGVSREPRRVCLWHEFKAPPWGGANQFMLALEAEMKRQGVIVTHNGEASPDGVRPSAHLINSCWFDEAAFRRAVDPRACRVVQRLDGPINLYRRIAGSVELDEKCLALNREFCCATVLQSRAVLRNLAAQGYDPVRPVIIHNAVDPSIFHPPKDGPRRSGPLRVIASAWSDNPGKGAAVFRWLDDHLDPRVATFTLVGRCQVELSRTRRVEALPSRELADELRGHDVYLAASRDDPCSNALIEALACGLPAVYFDSGGHPELVQLAGLPFDRAEDLPALLQRVGDHLEAYRRLITVEPIADVCRRYLAVLFANEPYRD